jgi:hypothetical protein
VSLEEAVILGYGSGNKVLLMNANEELPEVVAEFGQFIRGLPEEALVNKAWGPKEVLAHLVFWIESFVTQLEAVLAGEPYEPPQGRFEEINAQVINASRSIAVEELLRRHRVAGDRFWEPAQTRCRKDYCNGKRALSCALVAGSSARQGTSASTRRSGTTGRANWMVVTTGKLRGSR